MEQMVALISALYRWFNVNGEYHTPELRIYMDGDDGVWYAQVRYPAWDKESCVIAWLDDEDELRMINQKGESLYTLMPDNGFTAEDIIKIRFAKGSIKYLNAMGKLTIKY